ncbi:MAG: hypothetical protein OIF36_03090 [Alphaproteobacteria bacterium]|jgi:hypothetical protein|nr:hypothetical protein [Alphaproteobacteria bacterium]MCV6599448.1 hypothetical protein [Alphaproteobacteria bacterium]
MNRIKGRMKQKISNFIPSAFNRALCSYRIFSSRNVDMDETKEFSAYHSACKTALSHIDNLIKLSSYTEEEKVDKKEDDYIGDMLSVAKKQLEDINAATC